MSLQMLKNKKGVEGLRSRNGFVLMRPKKGRNLPKKWGKSANVNFAKMEQIMLPKKDSILQIQWDPI